MHIVGMYIEIWYMSSTINKFFFFSIAHNAPFF